MIAKMEFEDGFTVPWHSHENEQNHGSTGSTLRFWFDNDEENYIDLLPGDFVIIKEIVRTKR